MPVSGYDVIEYAKQFIGTPYVWGGNSLTEGVDCSGLTQLVLKHFGINISDTTFTQIGEGKGVKMNELQVGDLVFFDNTTKWDGPDHVAFYIGDGKILHAPRPGSSVRIGNLADQEGFIGGRRMAGMVGGDTASDWEPGADNPLPKLDPEALASEYGWAYSFLKSIPEVGSIFDSYVSENWDKAKFQAKLRETKWWQENSDTMRQAQQEKMTDPATFGAKVEAVKIQIQQLAAEMGAMIPTDKLGKFAEQAIQTGMDDALLRNLLGQYVTFSDKATLTGRAGMFERSMKEFAYQQGVTLDKQTIKNQAQLVARGLGTQEDFMNQITEQAASAFPAYADQLRGGQTMRQIASPYIQQLADDLEMPDSAFGLSDPLIKRALNGLSADGKPVGMSITDFQAVTRNDPRWRNTAKAQKQVMSTGMQILKDMGLVGGK
jgi:NlpC/P60 family protein